MKIIEQTLMEIENRWQNDHEAEGPAGKDIFVLCNIIVDLLTECEALEQELALWRTVRSGDDIR